MLIVESKCEHRTSDDKYRMLPLRFVPKWGPSGEFHHLNDHVLAKVRVVQHRRASIGISGRDFRGFDVRGQVVGDMLAAPESLKLFREVSSTLRTGQAHNPTSSPEMRIGT